MRSGCGCLGNVIGLWLALLFVAAIPTSVWLVNFSRTAFNADTYIETFADRNVYENLIPHVLPALAKHPNNREVSQLDFQSVIENMNQDDWDAIAQEVVPAPYIQGEIERNLAIYDDYVSGDRARLEIVFETGILRDNLLGPAGDRMVNRIFSSWPDCDAEGEAQIRAFLNNNSTEFPYCKPSDSRLQREVFTLLNEVKDDLANQIPAEWDLRREMAADRNITLREVDQRLYDQIQQPTALMRELTPLWFLIPAMFLAMVVIFAVGSARGFFRWVGIPMICGGIAALLPLGFVPFIISNAGNNHADQNSIVTETIRGVVLSLVSDFTTPILIQGAILVTIGFLFVFISMLLPDPHQPIPLTTSGSSGSGSTPVLKPDAPEKNQTSTTIPLSVEEAQDPNETDLTIVPTSDDTPS